MASETGTAGNDTLDHFGDAGPGTLIGLAGDDCIFTGSGAWTVTGDSGSDSIFLRTGNTGSITGGTENDCIVSTNAVGALTIFGNAGSDIIVFAAASGNLTVVGGDDSSDGLDVIFTGSGRDLIFGNGGNDIINSGTGGDTVVGGFGDDVVNGVSPGNDLTFGNEGNDVIAQGTGSDTSVGGLGNDQIINAVMAFGNEGANSIYNRFLTTATTIVGGVDSADGADSLVGSTTGADLMFGNGGADTISAADGL